MYEPQAGDLTVAAVGDVLVTRPLSAYREPGLLELVEQVREADLGFANLELTVRRDEGYPQAESGGTWVWAEPEVVRDVRWFGFHAVSIANNHMLDWGQDGLAATLRHLRSLGLAHAGAGRDLAEARRPAYVEAARGRIALLAATTTFHPWNRAGDARPDCPGRPGVHGLRLRRVIEVPPEVLRMLTDVNERLSLDARDRLRERLGFARPLPEGHVRFLDHVFRAGNGFRLHVEVHPRDREGLLRAVGDARRQADWVLVSIHCHEAEGEHLDRPPAFLVDLARACIEAGADAVLGHGPHVLRGIEVYLGKPILYSLGNFVFQNETLPYQPADFYELLELPADATPADLFDARSREGQGGFAAEPRYWESVLAMLRWRQRRLAELELIPVTLGHGTPRSMRGRPLRARGALAASIVARLAELSAAFGTPVTWDAAGECGRVVGPGS